MRGQSWTEDMGLLGHRRVSASFRMVGSHSLLSGSQSCQKVVTIPQPKSHPQRAISSLSVGVYPPLPSLSPHVTRVSIVSLVVWWLENPGYSSRCLCSSTPPRAPPRHKTLNCTP